MSRYLQVKDVPVRTGLAFDMAVMAAKTIFLIRLDCYRPRTLA